MLSLFYNFCWYSFLVKPMKYNEMRRICRENPLAFARFKDHISNQSSIRGFFIHKIFFLSFLSLFTRIPVLGRVSLAIQGLFAGYVVEFNMSKKTKNEEFAPVKVRFQNAPSQNEFFDHVIIGSGPGAATAALKLRNSPRVLILESGLSYLCENLFCILVNTCKIHVTIFREKLRNVFWWWDRFSVWGSINLDLNES